MADLNLIPENCQRCEDEESITAKAVIPPHPASSYVETYVGRAVPTGQYRIDRPSGPLTLNCTIPFCAVVASGPPGSPFSPFSPRSPFTP
ncbi:hypothetical protein C9Z57_23455 [Escherichia coli]|nr:hypothetical protein C9Z57_23455 [Escherichia coli]